MHVWYVDKELEQNHQVKEVPVIMVSMALPISIHVLLEQGLPTAY